MHRAPTKLQPHLRAWFSGRASSEENFGISFSGYSVCIRALLNQGLSDNEIACLANVDRRRIRILRQRSGAQKTRNL